ncbi:hypothetical protein [Vibrio ulleungensis]|uniref:hypothetical protein n=1 Tax=Vibrio ulleungensis TaxID=2807619 RepID=UPI002E2DD64E|nr:hypothetical protein [Vibrio ulleungensis]
MEREVFDALLQILQELFKIWAIRLVELGVPETFDHGFGYKKERVAMKGWAYHNGIDYELYYLDFLFEECCASI